MTARSSTLLLICLLLCYHVANGFPHLERRQSTAATVSTTGVAASGSVPVTPWSPAQLVDVTGSHAYQDPLPGQARGPCPAQNALANHGYLDRSGYTTYAACVAANLEVFNMSPDLGGYLCFMGQLTGGDFTGLSWSLGNSSAFDSSIQNGCSLPGLGRLLSGLLCGLSLVLDKVLGTPGFGMAQTHNSFEADSSFLQPDWHTIHGLDASTIDMTAASQLWQRRLPDDTFDDYQIILDWASYRKTYGIATNPCYMRVPQATIFAALGAYAFVPRLFSNATPQRPDGTLTGSTLASFFGFSVNAQGVLANKGLGKERIPNNWYRRATPYDISQWLAFDFASLFENDPTLSSVGGNTNGVNTFSGVDFGNLTGGVINSENLLQGDNFACFYYRILQIDLENKLPSAVGAGLIGLGPTLGDVLDAVFGQLVKGAGGVEACPTFTYTDVSAYGPYCGTVQQPGGTF